MWINKIHHVLSFNMILVFNFWEIMFWRYIFKNENVQNILWFMIISQNMLCVVVVVAIAVCYGPFPIRLVKSMLFHHLPLCWPREFGYCETGFPNEKKNRATAPHSTIPLVKHVPQNATNFVYKLMYIYEKYTFAHRYLMFAETWFSVLYWLTRTRCFKYANVNIGRSGAIGAYLFW